MIAEKSRERERDLNNNNTKRFEFGRGRGRIKSKAKGYCLPDLREFSQPLVFLKGSIRILKSDLNTDGVFKFGRPRHSVSVRNFCKKLQPFGESKQGKKQKHEKLRSRRSRIS